MNTEKDQLTLKYFEVLWRKKNAIMLSIFIYIGLIALGILISDAIAPFYTTLTDKPSDLIGLSSNFANEAILCSIPVFYLIVRYFMIRHQCNKLYNKINSNQ